MSGGLGKKKKKRGKDNHLYPLWDNFIPPAHQTRDPQFSWCLLLRCHSVSEGRNICLWASVIVEFQEVPSPLCLDIPSLLKTFARATACRIGGLDIDVIGSFNKMERLGNSSWVILDKQRHQVSVFRFLYQYVQRQTDREKWLQLVALPVINFLRMLKRG